MAKGSPSMVALLGLLAVAGFQNRDKLSGLLQSGQDRTGNRPSDADRSGEGGGLLESLRGGPSGAGGGGVVSGLKDLLDRFTNPVQSARAQSWVNTGPNAEIAPDDLADVLDDETLAELSQKTGLSRSELLTRLSANLPDEVDRMTPNGRIPTNEEAASIY